MNSSFVFGLSIVATLSTMALFLSPAPAMHRICRLKMTEGHSVVPLISLLGNCHIWLLYGLLTGNIFPLVVTFLFGEAMAMIYTAIFYRWTSDRAHAAKIVRHVAFILSLVTLYAVLAALGKTNQTTEQAGKCVGYIGVCASFILYLSPFESIMQVLTTKSGESIPINMCAAGTVSNAIWVAYAALTLDMFMLIPNAICMVLAAIQVTLYWVFRPKRYSSSSRKLLYSKSLESSDGDDDPTGTSSGEDTSPTAVRFGSPSGDYMGIVVSQ